MKFTKPIYKKPIEAPERTFEDLGVGVCFKTKTAVYIKIDNKRGVILNHSDNLSWVGGIYNICENIKVEPVIVTIEET